MADEPDFTRTHPRRITGRYWSYGPISWRPTRRRSTTRGAGDAEELRDEIRATDEELRAPEIRTHLRQHGRPAADAWVFVGPKGGRPTRANFHRLWHQARTAAGIPTLHLHDLRHTGNTLAAETGATLRELMDRMGHASARAALIYLHAREQRGQTIAAGIDAMVSKPTRTPKRKGTTGDKGHARGTRSDGVRK